MSVRISSSGADMNLDNNTNRWSNTGDQEAVNYHIVEIPYDKYKIYIKLSSDNKLLGIEKVVENRFFYGYQQNNNDFRKIEELFEDKE